jgi:glycosyltransferase involved in cell wall biosynthesis
MPDRLGYKINVSHARSLVTCSVVVTTYNSPATLRLVLLALGRQSILPSEALVADDGSSPETAEAVAQAAGRLPFRIVHVWQPHEGFRAARSRNNAIHLARGQCVAFLDQDTLPHRDWMERHLRRAGRGRMGLGHVLNMQAERAGPLTEADILSGAFETAHDRSEERRLAVLQWRFLGYALCRSLGMGKEGRPKLRSCNASAHIEDLRRVNGFDEAYVGWGQEDDDLGRRLYWAGVRPQILVRQALVSHLPHPSRRPERWEEGQNVRRYRGLRVPTACERGLADHPHGDVKVVEY